MTSFLLTAFACAVLSSLIALIEAWAGAVDGVEDSLGFTALGSDGAPLNRATPHPYP